MTLRSLARTFIRRDKESRAAGAPGLPLKLWFVRTLQAVGSLNTALGQVGGEMSREIAGAIFVEERFPEVVLGNLKERTTLTLLGNALGMIWYVVTGPGK